MSDNDTALVAATKPFYRELKAGQKILWCSCGRSKRQPFCDGRSHVGTSFLPVEYQAQQDEEVLLCACKQTCTAPFCDGAHSNLPGGYKDDSVDAALEALPIIAPDAQGFARLDGSCFVASPEQSDGASAYQTLVSPSLGAQYQAQFFLRYSHGDSPVYFSSAGDVVLWIAQGKGELTIGGRIFPIDGPGGVYIREGEKFQFTNVSALLSVYVSLCPGADALEQADAMDDVFDEAWPERLSLIDQESRQAMGPRYFQVLLEEKHGLRNTAQFIGHIPRSKAEMHRHLYEEALVMLSGEGMIWNETCRARVKAGDVIFFPRKHIHSLQCVCDEGMDVLGLIHPGTNPGINYL